MRFGQSRCPRFLARKGNDMQLSIPANSILRLCRNWPAIPWAKSTASWRTNRGRRRRELHGNAHLLEGTGTLRGPAPTTWDRLQLPLEQFVPRKPRVDAILAESLMRLLERWPASASPGSPSRRRTCWKPLKSVFPIQSEGRDLCPGGHSGGAKFWADLGADSLNVWNRSIAISTGWQPSAPAVAATCN